MVSGETVKRRSRKLLLVALFLAALSWPIGGYHVAVDVSDGATQIACDTQCGSGNGGG